MKQKITSDMEDELPMDIPRNSTFREKNVLPYWPAALLSPSDNVLVTLLMSHWNASAQSGNLGIIWVSLSPLSFYIQSSLNRINHNTLQALLCFATATALVKQGLWADGFHRGEKMKRHLVLLLLPKWIGFIVSKTNEKDISQQTPTC